MGTTIDAHCFACGHDRFMRTGGGMANHTTYAAWPVSCKSRKAVTTANFKSSPLACLKCGSTNVEPFDAAQNYQGDGEPVSNWGDLSLTNGHYRCPACGEFALRFGTNVGKHSHVLWD
jgi:hypothetical protein